LNQCDQFFRGQHTPASNRTWLASYHLSGGAQTWYYALEHDEGMPSWERFRDLCRLRFGPPLHGSRLAELGRLPFATTVQEFADRFQALACHAPDVSTRQRAELFVGGLPEHIRVDVEIHRPQDLQTAMYYARAFERRAAATPPALPARAARPVQRAGLPAPRAPGAGPAAPPPAAGAGAPGGRAFRRLTPAEQQERRRQGLCYNCDELYTPGHVC
jgi:hypothetical protein